MSIIGIPRGLYYFYYHKLWEVFLENLGFKVITSPSTNKEILNMGLLSSVDGFCLPMKSYLGHVHYLVKKGVNKLFIPQIISVQKGEYICPNFMGLPDLIAQNIPKDVKVFSPVLDGRKGTKGLIREYWNFGQKFAPLNLVKTSLSKAEQAQAEHDLIRRNTPCEKTNKMNILLLGPIYLTADSLLNGNLVQQLTDLGVHVITQEQINAEAMKGSHSLVNKPLFWSGARQSFDALSCFLGHVDGVIIACPFGCGAQSLINVLLEKCLKEHNVPCLELYFDEHTSPLGMQTRLEAFYDLLERKKYYENNLSTSG